MDPINEKNLGDCGYIATYKGQQIALYALGAYPAQQIAAKYFKAKKDWEVNVMLAEKSDGSQYVHTIDF